MSERERASESKWATEREKLERNPRWESGKRKSRQKRNHFTVGWNSVHWTEPFYSSRVRQLLKRPMRGQDASGKEERGGFHCFWQSWPTKHLTYWYPGTRYLCHLYLRKKGSDLSHCLTDMNAEEKSVSHCSGSAASLLRVWRIRAWFSNLSTTAVSLK